MKVFQNAVNLLFVFEGGRPKGTACKQGPLKRPAKTSPEEAEPEQPGELEAEEPHEEAGPEEPGEKKK